MPTPARFRPAPVPARLACVAGFVILALRRAYFPRVRRTTSPMDLAVYVLLAVVIGYPLVTGQIRVGPETLSRDDDPQAFWRAYTWSIVLFLCVSVATGFGLHAMLHGKL